MSLGAENDRFRVWIKGCRSWQTCFTGGRVLFWEKDMGLRLESPSIGHRQSLIRRGPNSVRHGPDSVDDGPNSVRRGPDSVADGQDSVDHRLSLLMPDKTQSVTDQTRSMMDRTRSVTDLTQSMTDQTRSVTDPTLSMPDLRPSAHQNLACRAEKPASAPFSTLSGPKEPFSETDQTLSATQPERSTWHKSPSFGMESVPKANQSLGPAA